MMSELKHRSLTSIARDIYHIAQPFEGATPHGKLVAIADELMHHHTPDPRVTQLVEAAREAVTKLDNFFGSYVFPFDNFKEVESLRAAIKAMDQSND